ncbi:MAG: polymerase, sigma-24 subunit, subfamily [Thermoleophilia bacterium]|nr:polymerase, sigma-24 subunit, subfamily [Thermoleophilia bacterium]
MQNDSGTDGELFLRARRDPHAFDAVYARHARVIKDWLKRQCGDESEAWELTAEVFAQAWISRRRFRPDAEGSAAPWLFGIAKNVHRHSSRRRRSRHKATRRLGMQVLQVTPSDEDDRLQRMVIEAIGPDLHAALDRLPHGQRIAVQLRVLEELPYEEIASRLDCTVEAVRVRVLRGLRSLRADLEGRLT